VLSINPVGCADSYMCTRTHGVGWGATGSSVLLRRVTALTSLTLVDCLGALGEVGVAGLVLGCSLWFQAMCFPHSQQCQFGQQLLVPLVTP
jgi:hypothetical protein